MLQNSFSFFVKEVIQTDLYPKKTRYLIHKQRICLATSKKLFIFASPKKCLRTGMFN